jgi:hypothetical protein
LPAPQETNNLIRSIVQEQHCMRARWKIWLFDIPKTMSSQAKVGMYLVRAISPEKKKEKRNLVDADKAAAHPDSSMTLLPAFTLRQRQGYHQKTPVPLPQR